MISDAREVYNSFAEEFGDRPFRDEFHREGDLVREDAPSVVENGHVIRVFNLLEVKEIKIEFVVLDEEASMSFADLEKVYFKPAAKWLRKQLGDLMVLAIPSTPHFTDTEIVNVRGLQMVARYDSLQQGHAFMFRVLAATPAPTEAEKADAALEHPFNYLEPGGKVTINGIRYSRFTADDGMDCYSMLDESLLTVMLE